MVWLLWALRKSGIDMEPLARSYHRVFSLFGDLLGHGWCTSWEDSQWRLTRVQYCRVPNTFKILEASRASNLKIKVAFPNFYWPFYIFFVFWAGMIHLSTNNKGMYVLLWWHYISMHVQEDGAQYVYPILCICCQINVCICMYPYINLAMKTPISC